MVPNPSAEPESGRQSTWDRSLVWWSDHPPLGGAGPGWHELQGVMKQLHTHIGQKHGAHPEMAGSEGGGGRRIQLGLACDM